MQLIAGLGNPGSQYQRNRHNVGFMAVDEIHRHHSFSPWRRKFQAMVSQGLIDGEKVLLMKPMTFMNESGRAIGEAANFYKLAPEQIVVIYDELDLPAGKLRMKQGGGHGGHNGPRSIHAHIGGNYRRLRVGIGHPGDKNRVHNWVLSDFAKSDQQWLEPLLAVIARNSEFLVRGDDAGFSNKVHLMLGANGKSSKKGPPSGNPETPPAKAKTEANSSPDETPSNPFVEAFARLIGRPKNTN